MASRSPHHSKSEGGPRLRTKRLWIDRDKLERAIAILGAGTEAEAIDKALDLVLLGDDLNEDIGRLAAAGEIENCFDEHPA